MLLFLADLDDDLDDILSRVHYLHGKYVWFPALQV